MASKSSLLLLAGLLLVLSITPSCASAKRLKPKKLDFYMLIVVQNLTRLDSLEGQYTAVRTAAPEVEYPFTFGVLNTFDNRISKAPSLDNPADLVGRVQGWYGDCGKDRLVLCLTQIFTYDDGRLNGTFSLMGVSVATAPVKEAAIVGGTGHFAFCRGIATQQHVSDVNINNEENSWFLYSVKFRC